MKVLPRSLIDSAFFQRQKGKAELKRKAELKKKAEAAALIAEKRAKETRCAPAKRLEITARGNF
jgi:hypothetical protein